MSGTDVTCDALFLRASSEMLSTAPEWDCTDWDDYIGPTMYFAGDDREAMPPFMPAVPPFML
eukprot:3931700-Rhodomonas_salina.3